MTAVVFKVTRPPITRPYFLTGGQLHRGRHEMPASPQSSLEPHCCLASGYGLTTGPHPTPWTVYLYFEQSCTLMPGSLTWIPRESRRRKVGEEKRRKLTHTVQQEKDPPPSSPSTIIFLKRRLCLIQGPFVSETAELMGGDCVAAFICSGRGSRGRPLSEPLQILL